MTEVAVPLSRRPRGARRPGHRPGRRSPPPRVASTTPSCCALDAGEQYRFGFDMNSCIGCHSCEVACAEQNGLPAGTVWRRVGEIEGGDHPQTRRFHLSMSCNHCLDPACLDGLPDQRLREARQRHRRPPRRRLHRLPVLHLDLPVLGAGLPARPAHRHQVRHVPAPPGRRVPAGLRRRLPDPRHHRREGERGRRWRADHRAGRRPRAAEQRPDAVDHPHRAARATCRSRRYAASDWNLRPEEPHWPLVWLTLRQPGGARRQRHRRRPAAERLLAAALAGAGHGRRARPPRPAGRGVEGAAQPAPVVAQPRGGPARRCTPRWRPAPVLVPGPRAGRRRRRRGRACSPRPASTWCPAGRRGTRRSRSCASSPPRWPSGHRSTGPPGAGGAAGGVVAVGGHRRQLGAPGPPRRPVRGAGSVRLELRLVPAWPPPSALVATAVGVAAALAGGPAARRVRGRWPSASSSAAGCSSSPSCRSTCPARSGGATGADEATGDGARRRSASAARRSTTAATATRYVDDPVRGPVSASRAADRWVRTTCGYCSVGCGMLRRRPRRPGGRRRGRPRPPRQPRAGCAPRACPSTRCWRPRAGSPRPTVDGRPATWDAGARPGGRRLPRPARRHGPESVAVLSTGQLVTEEFYALGKLVRLGMGLAHYDGNTTLCMASRGGRLQAAASAPTARPAATTTSSWPTCSCCGAPTSPTTTRCWCPGCWATAGRHASIVVDPRVTKTAMMADIHLPVRPRGDVALLNGDAQGALDEGLVDPDAVARPRRRARRAARPTSQALDRRAGGRRERHRRRRRSATVARTIGRRRALHARLDDGRQPLGAGHRDGHAAQHAGACSPATSAGRGRRRSRSPASATPWAPGRRASPPRCPATGPTTTRPHRAELAALWASTRTACRPSGAGPTPTSSTRVMSRPHQGPVDHRHQPVGVVPQPRACSSRPSAASTCSSCRTASRRRRPRWPTSCCPPPSGARRTARSPTASAGCRGCGRRSSRRARPAPTSTSSSAWPSAGAARDELFAGWTGPGGRLRRVAAGVGRTARATTAASPGSASTRPAACSGRAPTATDVPLGGTPRLYADRRVQPTPTAGPAVRAVEPEPHPRRAPAASTRSCSTPAAPSSTGTPAPRPAGSPILEGLAPEAWVEVHPADAAALGVRAGDRVRVSVARGARSSGIRVRVTAIVPAGRGVHPVPLGRALRQPPHRRRVRPDQPRAQLQAVRGQGRVAPHPRRSLTPAPLTAPAVGASTVSEQT